MILATARPPVYRAFAAIGLTRLARVPGASIAPEWADRVSAGSVDISRSADAVVALQPNRVSGCRRIKLGMNFSSAALEEALKVPIAAASGSRRRIGKNRLISRR